MATSSGTGDSLELLISLDGGDEDPNTLLQRILNWYAAHSPEPDIIDLEWDKPGARRVPGADRAGFEFLWWLITV